MFITIRFHYYNRIYIFTYKIIDTEDWSNDTESSDLITAIHLIVTLIQIENGYFKL